MKNALDELRQRTVLKVYDYDFKYARVVLERVSDAVIRVIYRDQVGYIGVHTDFGAGKPYTWSSSESGVSEAGLAYGGMRYERAESALNDLCRVMLADQRKDDSKRINPVERQRAARVVLGEFFDGLPEWDGGWVGGPSEI